MKDRAVPATVRLLTAAGRNTSPSRGYFVHRSPSGYIYLVTNQGTLAPGRTDFSAAVWHASKPQPAAIAA